MTVVPYIHINIHTLRARHSRLCGARSGSPQLATCRAWFGASLSEVVLRMVYGNVMVMIVRMGIGSISSVSIASL